MSFWSRFGFQTSSALDAVLARDDFTLADVLNEEDLLTECRTQNRKLIDYLVLPGTLEELIKLVTSLPDDLEDEAQRYKYPYFASEVLNLDIYEINEALLHNPDLLTLLWDFFGQPAPADGLLSNYVTRICTSLFMRQGPETLAFLKNQDGLVAKLVAHFETPSVPELLLRLISIDEGIEGGPAQSWLREQGLVSLLADSLDAERDPLLHENVSFFFEQLIDMSPYDQTAVFIEDLTSGTVLDRLVAGLKSDSKSLFLACIPIVTKLLERFTKEETILDAEPTTSLPAFAQAVLSALPALAQRLQPEQAPAEPNDEILAGGRVVALPLSNGERIAPIGHERLKILDILSTFVRLRSAPVDDLIIESNILESVFALFFNYPWNNFVHSSVRNLISDVFCGVNTAFKLAICQRYQLVDRLIHAATQNKEFTDGSTLASGRGYLGFVIQLSNGIGSCVSDSQVSDFLDNHATWSEFLNGLLCDLNEIENTELGGHLPIRNDGTESSSDGDAAFEGGTNSELVNVFKQMLSTHQFSGDYPPQYGDDEDEYDDGDEDEDEGHGSDELDNDFEPNQHDADDDDADDDDAGHSTTNQDETDANTTNLPTINEEDQNQQVADDEINE